MSYGMKMAGPRRRAHRHEPTRACMLCGHALPHGEYKPRRREVWSFHEVSEPPPATVTVHVPGLGDVEATPLRHAYRFERVEFVWGCRNTRSCRRRQDANAVADDQAMLSVFPQPSGAWADDDDDDDDDEGEDQG